MPETVNVRGASDSLYEGMTAEQIETAIVNAVESGTVGDIDTGFVTTLKEQNNGTGVMLWVGTTAEYNALDPKPNNCIFIKTDDTSATDIDTAITALQTAAGTASDNIITLQSAVTAITTKLNKIEIVEEAEDPTLTLTQIFSKYSANYVVYRLNTVSDTSIYPETVTASPGTTNAAIVTLERVGNVGRFTFDFKGNIYYNSIYASTGGYSTSGWKQLNEAV